MVKPDLKHNYYSDLDLPTTASLDDIRKAYRKLALQYHPDRNAGREAECVPRFQAIQAANEVLSDPATKAKYDQDRQRTGINPSSFRSAGPTGNPYKATSAYPPPPRRTQPGTWQRPTPSTGPSQGVPTGAERFTAFPRPTASAAPKNPATGRAQQFHAWQKMNNPGTSAPQPSRPAPPPMPPRQEQKPQPKARPGMPTEEKIRANFQYKPAPSPESDKTSAWQHRQASWAAQDGASKKPGPGGLGRSYTQRTPRKNGGFDPMAPGSDERPAPAAGSRYTTRHRSEDYGSPRNEVPPPPPGPPPAVDLESPISPSSQRSYNATSPLRPNFRSHTSDEQDVPYSEANRKSTPYSSGSAFVGEKTQFTSPMYRSASSKDTTKLNPDSARSTRARSISPVSQRQPDGSKTNPFVQYSSSDESSEERPFSTTPEEFDRDDASHDQAGTAPTNASQDRPKKTPAPPSRRFNGTPQEDGASPGPSLRGQMPSMQQRQSGNNIFTVPFNPPPAFAQSRSEENINTNFSPGGFSGPFTGSTEYFPPPPTTSRRASPTRRNFQHNGPRSATTDVPPGSSSSPESIPPRFGSDGNENLRASPTNTTFDHQDWAQKFKDGSWAFPPPPPNPPHSGQAQQPDSVPDASTKSGAHQSSAETGEDTQTGHDSRREQNSGTAVGSDKTTSAENDFDAMDIDMQPPATNQQSKQTSQTSSRNARPVSVPLPKWRQQHDDAKRNGNATATRRSQQSADNTGLNVNLNDLLTSQPLGPGVDEGLHNLADLSSTLPFSSQPATQVPLHSMEPQTLETPPVPQAPEPPSRMTKITWRIHAQNFGRYLEAYHAFNRTMIMHFDAREKQSQARMLGGTSWLEAIGDGSSVSGGFAGFGSYWKGVREDEAVRETWRVGCERHFEAVKKFANLRDRVKHLVASNALPDV